jgi:hypothetical protein
MVCDFIAAFLTPDFSGYASFALEFKNSFISPRAFYCWRRNVVVPSSLIYQMFILTLSPLLRFEPLLMCVPAGKLSGILLMVICPWFHYAAKSLFCLGFVF